MSFFTELKRRNVFRVGAAYAIVAWLMIQIVVAVKAPLHLPDWTDTLIIILLFIGFPVAIFLAWVYELTPEGIKTTTPEGPAQFHTRTTGQRLNYFIIGALALAAGFVLVDRYVLNVPGTTMVASSIPTATSATKQETNTRNTVPVPLRSATSALVTRSLIDLGETQPFEAANLDTFIALSRDGRQLLYAKREGGTSRLYYRAMDQLEARPIPGTEGASDAFFSPDGQWITFEAERGLYKVALTGSTPQKLAGNIPLPRGAFWSEENTIYFSNSNGKLQRINANGGTPQPVALQSEYASWYHAWPVGLPDGKHLLLTVQQGIINATDGNIILLNPATGETRLLIRNGFNARYVSTGHIVFMRAGSLWAVPFDASQLRTTGPEVPVVNGVETSGGLGQAVYAVSDAGAFVYLPGEDVQRTASNVGQLNQLVWVDRSGQETPAGVKPDNYQNLRLSPDGRQAALTIGPWTTGLDIWTYDFKRGILNRRTFDGNAGMPLWSPDGTYLAYATMPHFHGLARTRADGAGQTEALLAVPRFLLPTSFTPDGSQLIYNEFVTGPEDLYTLPIKGQHTEKALLKTEFSEADGVLSPDGHWLAYVSNRTKQYEIFVCPFPDVEDGKWQVSNNGGVDPRWRGDGKELFYRQGQAPLTMMAVPIDTRQGFEPGTPKALFQGNYFSGGNNINLYDVTADGQRFLMLKQAAESGSEKEPATKQTSLVLVENWFAELKRLAPPAK